MPDVYFGDKSKQPDDESLEAALGKTKRFWDDILAFADGLRDAPAREWKFYGAKYGWQLKLAGKKRALLYLIPRKGTFTAGMALNDKAVAALATSGLPPDLVREIETAKVFPEGRPARLEVTTKKQSDIVKQLMRIKSS